MTFFVNFLLLLFLKHLINAFLLVRIFLVHTAMDRAARICGATRTYRLQAAGGVEGLKKYPAIENIVLKTFCHEKR